MKKERKIIGPRKPDSSVASPLVSESNIDIISAYAPFSFQ